MTDTKDESFDLLESVSSDSLLYFIKALISTPDSRAECADPSDIIEPTLSAYTSTDIQQALYVLVKSDGQFSVKSELVDVVSADTVSMTILLKHSGILRADVSLRSQINVISTPMNESYNSRSSHSPVLVRDLLTHVVAPYIDRLSSKDSESSASGSLTLAKKKLNELNATLSHIDSEIEVPNLLGHVPPAIMELLREPQNKDEMIVQDTTTLNELTQIANTWIRQVQSITKKAKSPSDSWSMADETRFWVSMESALMSLHQQLQQQEVENLIRILNASKRYQTTFVFQNNLQVTEKLQEVRQYNSFLKDLNLTELVTSKDSRDPIAEFDSNLSIIFSQLKRWKTSSSVPPPSIIQLTELALSDISVSLASMLSSLSIMAMPQEAFETTVNLKIRRVFQNIDGFIKSMTNILREFMRKGSVKFMVIKIEQTCINLIEQRVDDLVNLKSQHHTLVQGLLHCAADETLTSQLLDAYNKHIIAADYFDLSKDGLLIWAAQEDSYLGIHNKISQNLASSLNNRIDHCTSYSDYVSFFENIVKAGTDANILLPLIEDNHKIKFLTEASKSLQGLLMSSKHNIRLEPLRLQSKTPLDSIDTILLMVSLKHNVDNLIQTLSRSLGETWTLFAIGSQIQDLATSLREKLDVTKVFETWCQSVRAALTELNKVDNLLCLDEDLHLKKRVPLLSIPLQLFEVPRSISIFKNVGFNIPSDLVLEASRINNVGSIIFTLNEHIEALTQTMNSVCEFHGLEYVLESLKQDAFHKLLGISSLSWADLRSDANLLTEDTDFSKIDMTSMRLVHQFQESTHLLFDLQTCVDNFRRLMDEQYLPALKACEFESLQIQKCVDQIDIAAVPLMQKVSDASPFEESLRDILTESIVAKLEACLQQFSKGLNGDDLLLSKWKTYHVLRYEGGNFFLEPPLVSSKLSWISEVNNLQTIIGNVTFRDSNGSPQKVIASFSGSTRDYLWRTLSDIDDLFDLVDQRMEDWHVLGEALKSLSKQDPFQNLGIRKSLEKVSLMLRCGSQLENPKGLITLGGILDISYSMVRNQLLGQYETFKSSLLDNFMQNVAKHSRTYLTSMNDIERLLSFDPNWQQPFAAIVKYAIHLFSAEQLVAEGSQTKGLVAECQKILLQNNKQLSMIWIYPDHFENKLSNLQQLIQLRMQFVEENLDRFQASLATEVKSCNDKFETITSDWFNKRPITASMEPGHALSVLTKLTKKLKDLEDYQKQICIVAEKLQVTTPNASSMQSFQDEINDLVVVWKALQELWDSVDDIKAIRWAEANPRKVRQQLESLTSSTKGLPAMVRHYSAFSVVKNTIASYISELKMLSDLKSDALKPRHWKKILAVVGSPRTLSLENLKLSQMFELEFRLHESFIKTIVRQANDERIIEESLNKVEEELSTVAFETFDFHGKCRLVRNWDKLFDVCQASISTLSSMKNSVSYGEFEERRSALEGQLYELESIFDSWIEVQKHWAYLDGVFSTNPDIRSSLPTESTRFNNLSFEFMGLLKRISKMTMVFEVFSIKDLKNTLSKIKESLERTKKGLTNYLEKQRELFPRFYFLGNEDLLELIGGAGDFTRINKHIKQMFFGVELLIKDNDTQCIVEVVSPEGEKLKLANPISIFKVHELHELLGQLETQIRLSVALLILKAVDELKAVFQGSYDVKILADITRQYPAQVLVVAFNVMFTRMAEKATEYAPLCTLYEELLKDVASFSNSSFSLECLKISQGRFELPYGFEYQGVIERLAVTPLVDRCYLALTSALAQGLGGSPFGPAGTGKTESVKALGFSLGRMVKVFNCDDSFDFKSMERILLGLCKVGCWGCFDEFNRLDSANLSALASQIEGIQQGLNNRSKQVAVSGASFSIHPNTGLFVTMNPGYAGRNELPENMKRLFRSVSMEKPDLELIIDVILTSHKLIHTKTLSKKIVHFFKGLSEAVSDQRHYDFGLRAIKSILRMCGSKRFNSDSSENQSVHDDPELLKELEILKASLEESILPKLVPQDVTVFYDLMSKIFEGVKWAENLNSVLDDNKILTLPNGERLELPDNVRIIFEVDNLTHATLATITRCGMIWFDRSLIKAELVWEKFLFKLRQNSLETQSSQDLEGFEMEKIQLQQHIAEIACTLGEELFDQVYEISLNFDHIMKHSSQRALNSFFTFFETQISKLVTFKIKNPAHTWESLNKFVMSAILHSLVWGYSGDSPVEQRNAFASQLASMDLFELLAVPENITEYFISPIDFEWSPWSQHIESVELEPQHVMDSNTIVPTVDILVHEDIINSLMNKHTPLLLCGPPGSGKTMTFLQALRNSPSLDLVSLNFSKDTTPESLISSLEQHCRYKRSNEGLTLSPNVSGKWTVVFCDEINLPSMDEYGCQRVIALIRLMVERQGFWSSRHKTWVTLENIQFVGACNDPNDPGRHQLAERFLRHVCVVMVDYPGKNSMAQIYENFNHAALKCAPDLRGFGKPLTSAMLDVYFGSKEKLTRAIRSHYVYSPRELTRWCRGILETILQSTYDDLPGLLRLWFHEGLRLFFDRLCGEEEKEWTKQLLLEAAAKHFPHTDLKSAFQEPILYSNWLSSAYEPVSMDELASFVRERCRVFSEEELETALVPFEDMLDHILRIDRVLRQHQGHMILVGPSSSGKSTLTKFVAWMNGIKVVQMRVHRGYSIQDFQKKLRQVLFACLKGEKLCFLIDESSLLETAFIERMNTLLANSEVPGLFEGDDYTSLMKECAIESTAQGLLLDSEDELYAWFTEQVSTNLHVVFTLSDVGHGDKMQVNSSPALFNRCVLNWMGDWTRRSLEEIASVKLQDIALDSSTYEPPSDDETADQTLRGAMISVCVSIHLSNDAYPNQFMRFLQLTIDLYNQKDSELNVNQRHILVGLDKLRETVLEVTEMKQVLSKKQESLHAKEIDAKNMLDKMIVNQNEAERKREFSVATQEELEKNEIQINKRREVVMQELELAEPAVLEAQRGVQNIKKQHLTEMRSMSNPPAAVKMAMESVCILLGYDVKTWRDVQLVVRKDDFITSIVSYDSETQLTPESSEFMERTYLSRSDFNFETVNRASKACGPLLQWVIAQLRYYSILEKVMPLKEEVAYLQGAAKKSKAQLIAIADMIRELEEKIVEYKTSYSDIIREAERLKVEMETIERKVSRSEELIQNLTSERRRWESNVKICDEERSRIAGNSILSAAFATYSGRYEQSKRDALLTNWKQSLMKLHIPFDKYHSPITNLATSEQAADWMHRGLPKDELYEQNFAIKEWAEFVLVTNTVEDVLKALTFSTSAKSVERTSFLDASFMRDTENAMRFGGTILISHAELYDPVMDPIIRKEITHIGGRRLVQLENREVDISPEFKLILVSNDPSASIPSSFLSRVNVLNFMITTSNVQRQTLNLCLKRVQPDLYQKHEEITLLQGDYLARGHALRQKLLDTLNNVAGTILDNDEATETLSSIQSQSRELDKKFGELNGTMMEVEKVRVAYLDIAEHLGKVHQILSVLSSKSKIYNFSFNTLVAILQTILDRQGKSENLVALRLQFYCDVFATAAPALRNMDRISLALALVVGYFEVSEGYSTSQGMLAIIGMVGTNPTSAQLAKLMKDYFSLEIGDESKTGQWNDVLNEADSPAIVSIKPLVLKLIGSEMTWFDAMETATNSVFGTPLSQTKIFGLSDWKKFQKSIFLIAESDHIDSTPQIERQAVQHNCNLKVIAMGTADGLNTAYKEVEKALISGSWVVLQNVQLSGAWLNELDQLLDKRKAHDSFALFMTCSLSATNIPSALLSKANVLTHEETPTFKAILLESFSYLWKQQVCLLPAAKTICFLISWYHAVIQENLKFVPNAFAKKYDISEVDLNSTALYLRKIFDSLDGKSVIRTEELPWDEISSILGQVLYGGKVSIEKDAAFCKELAMQLFNPKCCDDDYNLPHTQLKIPFDDEFEVYAKWIEDLPENIPHEWIGLDSGAMAETLANEAALICKTVITITK
ncbi:uncharacterized protein CXQ87_002799 [Candidozyma duobushaemuli]|uniref:Dynein heavy chain, cytoplasmic n=1 Tax=Candidozyma duobushaemuli TaxID=1231522 RepID=A0A2V1AA65_9ASCO|nr:uncharacterized protein CXQ87_002799 [[Candida] duobushaemulonis]PVH14652.1 hypothetical protein CXQ87_002799 [[Candida] duobushaemulonis]